MRADKGQTSVGSALAARAVRRTCSARARNLPTAGLEPLRIGRARGPKFLQEPALNGLAGDVEPLGEGINVEVGFTSGNEQQPGAFRVRLAVDVQDRPPWKRRGR